MTEHPQYTLTQQLQGLITRAVEGRILDEEVEQLHASVEALVTHPGEPVTTLELARVLRDCTPDWVSLTQTTSFLMATDLGKRLAFTKLPHEGLME